MTDQPIIALLRVAEQWASRGDDCGMLARAVLRAWGFVGAISPEDANDLDEMLVVRHLSVLPDGSAFATVSWPLPKTHWLYAEGHNVPPMPLRMGTDNPERKAMNHKVWAAAKYAVRCATMNGKEPDFDPDALCQNMVVGLLGYHTADGLSSDSWENPPQAEPGAQRGN